MQTLKLLLLALIMSLVPAQLIRIQLSSNGALTITDILSLIVVFAFTLYWVFKKIKVIVPGKIFIFGVLFLLWATSSTIFAANFLSFGQVITSSLFIIRLASYFLLTVVVTSLIKKQESEKWLKVILISAVIFTITGFLQFFLYPNLQALEQYGWDPHVSRLVATTLDPNYTGGLLAIFSALSISFYLYKKKAIYLALTAFFTIALLLTFSRSSYLAYITAMFLIGIIKSPKLIIFALVLFIVAFLSFAQIRERIVGAFLIDKTATARIESWQKAIVIAGDNPLFGVGFNAYRYAQERHDFVNSDNLNGGHSGGGVDSTLLLIVATTGIVGLTFYLAWLGAILLEIKKNLRVSPLSLGVFASFTAIIVNTQFVNSLLYPQIMLILWFLIGLQFTNDN